MAANEFSHRSFSIFTMIFGVVVENNFLGVVVENNSTQA